MLIPEEPASSLLLSSKSNKQTNEQNTSKECSQCLSVVVVENKLSKGRRQR